MARCFTYGALSIRKGKILESYVTKTRDKAAALTFMKKAMKRRIPGSDHR
ncbi:hypothetical protein K663_09705 [Sphingobium sp. MI1205]|nr:hypothetical protein K663_09705 [Sphingobium sp. MI1205]